MANIKLLLLMFLLSGCGVTTVNLGFQKASDDFEYPILIHVMNNPEQTLFSKIVKFDEKIISDGKGEFLKILPGTHQLDVKWSAILNEGDYSYFITGVLPSDGFLTTIENYHIKTNFEKGYTYMVDQGQLYNKDKYLPSKLCLFKRPTLKDKVSAYKNGSVFQNMELVDCFNYGGNPQKDYRISDRPW